VLLPVPLLLRSGQRLLRTRLHRPAETKVHTHTHSRMHTLSLSVLSIFCHANCPPQCYFLSLTHIHIPSRTHSLRPPPSPLPSGLDFGSHKTRGIDVVEFAEVLMCSGVVLNDDVRWLTFHSGYDYAYLMRLLTCKPLPKTEQVCACVCVCVCVLMYVCVSNILLHSFFFVSIAHNRTQSHTALHSTPLHLTPHTTPHAGVFRAAPALLPGHIRCKIPHQELRATQGTRVYVVCVCVYVCV
jgi:hypothetical protein